MRRAQIRIELPATYDVTRTHDAWFAAAAGNLLGGYGVAKQRELMVEQLDLPADVEVQFVEWDRILWAVTIYVAGDGLAEKYECEPGFEPLRVPVVDERVVWE